MESVAANVTEPSVGKLLLSAFFTQGELARELGVTRKTLDRWKLEGKGPSITKIGRKILYSRKGVISWLAACEEDPHRRDRRFGSRAKRRA
jgi:hypothetical protein